MSTAVWVSRLDVKYIPPPSLSLDEGWREVALDQLAIPVLKSRHWRSRDGMTVIETVDAYSDGSTWLHVSLSRPRYVPTYADLVRVKRVFVGVDREAVQKFAAEGEHVNIESHTLHLWARLDGPATPDFRLFDARARGLAV